MRRSVWFESVVTVRWKRACCCLPPQSVHIPQTRSPPTPLPPPTTTQAAQAQLQRVALLARVGEYDNARLQLRDGAFKTLRLDLGYGQDAFKLVDPKDARAVVERVEALDGALKRRAAPEALAPMFEDLTARLAAVGAAAARLEEVS